MAVHSLYTHLILRWEERNDDLALRELNYACTDLVFRVGSCGLLTERQFVLDALKAAGLRTDGIV